MSNLQIIEALTDIVSKQSEIIRIQADALAQVGAVCAEEQIVSESDRPAFGRGRAPVSALMEAAGKEVVAYDCRFLIVAQSAERREHEHPRLTCSSRTCGRRAYGGHKNFSD